MNYILNIIIEAIIVGILLYITNVIIWKIRFLIRRNFFPTPWFTPDVLLIITGFTLHIVLDLLGVNRWYCKKCAGFH